MLWVPNPELCPPKAEGDCCCCCCCPPKAVDCPNAEGPPLPAPPKAEGVDEGCPNALTCWLLPPPPKADGPLRLVPPKEADWLPPKEPNALVLALLPPPKADCPPKIGGGADDPNALTLLPLPLDGLPKADVPAPKPPPVDATFWAARLSAGCSKRQLLPKTQRSWR